MQVYCYDEKGYFTISKTISEEEFGINMTTTVVEGFYKPKFDGNTWVEGATKEEIDEINKPTEPKPTEEDKITLLEAQVATLEMIDAGLLLENASQQVKVQDQEITSANLLLEVAMLKGGI